MNLERLKELEKEFLLQYPGGFETEDIKKAGKKHNLAKHVKYLKETCSEENMRKGLDVYNDVMKVVINSSMVSVFEKVRFRDFIKEIDEMEKLELMGSIYEMLHGDEKEGFTRLVSLLSFYKMAKWPIITVFLALSDLEYQVFVKPTTAKKIIKALELEDIQYSPKATYEFYSKFRYYINELKKHVNSKLQVVNPAFTGFLMMTIHD